MIRKESLLKLLKTYAPCLSYSHVDLEYKAKGIVSAAQCYIYEEARNICRCCYKKKECELKNGKSVDS